MIWIAGELLDENNLKVTTVHYEPDTIDDSTKAMGFLVLELPKPSKGYYPQYYYNIDTGELTMEEIPHGKTAQEQIDELIAEDKKNKQTNAKMLLALARNGIPV